MRGIVSRAILPGLQTVLGLVITPATAVTVDPGDVLVADPETPPGFARAFFEANP
jgi:hypothetical protein